MAAPPSKTLKDLNGAWVMNKKLSMDPDACLALQGISWPIRKLVGVATVTLHVKQYEAPPKPPGDANGAPVTHIDIDQTATAGLKGSTELRCVDNTWREHKDWMFGHVRARSEWVKAADIGDEFLAKGWIESDAENVGPNGESHLLSFAESLDSDWVARQIWGFQTVDGARMYARNIVITRGEEKREVTLIYDYIVD